MSGGAGPESVPPMLGRREKAQLRARWPADTVHRLNADFIRSIPKRSMWSMDELRAEFPDHEVGGERYVDLRGFPFHELRHVTWDHVDLSGASFLSSAHRKQFLDPKLIGTGSVGSRFSRFTHCRFVAVDAKDANIAGGYEDCDFSASRLQMMDFFVGVSLTRCSFRGANLARSKAITDVRFAGCDLTGASLKECQLQGTVFEDCVLDDTVLDGAGLMRVRFVRCSWRNVSLDNIIAEENTLIDTEAPAGTAARLTDALPAPGHLPWDARDRQR
jgi:uncharacterized protein YjbI with pentapeptide repeats